LKTQGWRRHSREHALAARGIPCRAAAIFRPYRPMGYIDYDEPRELIFSFWKSSIENDWEDFDFDKAIESTLKKVDEYLFLLMIDEFDGFGPERREEIYNFAIHMRGYPEKAVGRLAMDLLKAKKGTELEKIIALDNIIHYQHATGSIFEGKDGELTYYLDVPEMREEFEQIYGTFSNGKEKVFYHGTEGENADRIMRHGFRVPKGSDGVSVTDDFDMAVSYTNVEYLDPSGEERAYVEDDVIIVRVKPGAKPIRGEKDWGKDILTGEWVYRPEDLEIIGRGRR